MGLLAAAEAWVARDHEAESVAMQPLRVHALM
jgi:hypothetical protein